MDNTRDIARDLNRPYLRNETYGYNVPTGLIAVWVSCGWIFQLDFDLQNDKEVDALVHWWLRGARKDFPGIADIVDESLIVPLHMQPLEEFGAKRDAFLTPLMRIILRHRKDLSEVFDVETTEGIRAFWGWWLTAGEIDYLGNHRSPIIPMCCLDAVSQNGVPNHILHIWSHRADLFDKFDVSTPEGRDGLLYWWITYGASYYTQFTAQHAGLGEDFFAVSERERIVPPAIEIVWKNRPDLRKAFDMATQAGRRALLEWWLADGRNDYPAISRAVGTGLREGLHEAFSMQAPSPVVTPLIEIIWNGRPDLQGAFDLTNEEGRTGIVQWWKHHAVDSYPDLFPVRPEEVRATGEAEAAGTGRVAASPPTFDKIALVGHPRGEFGLGEDIRLMRASLQTVGIEPEIVRVPWKITAREQAKEASIEAHEADFDGDATFFVMPAFDTTLLLAKSGPKVFGARRRIGFWQWELEKFPEPARIAMTLVDEIWCHSEHSARAFRAATDKPVIKVPLPVMVPAVRKASRAEFGLPEGCFVVFTAFDGASAIARKNPLGSIEAFQKAFPAAGHADKRLVIKAMNAWSDSLWRECLRRAELDQRIIVREGVLDKDDYYALLACCDAILSLHRAEGFGRLMAEGMVLGIPIIATGYSGNMDFMNDDNSWPVSGALVRIFPGDYAFHDGQVWMEPDIAQAATALVECASNEELRRRKVQAARTTMQAYSPQACGERYRQLLESGGEASTRSSRSH